MPQTAEGAAFIARIVELPPNPGVNLDVILKPSLDDEAGLRKLFAKEKTNSQLSDIHVGLVDVFDAPPDIRTTRARVVKDEQDLSRKYIYPLQESRRRREGTPAMVDNLNDFRRNWSIFTEGSLSQLSDWKNVVAAGGAVQACLEPLPQSAQVSKRTIRKHYHSNAFPTSDVDLFLYGLTPDQAEVKINQIYEAIRDSIPWDVTCIRTKYTVSIHSQYPYRAVQIVLRLYQSPAEILAGFDVDAACFAYDGERVWGNPRSIVAMMRQCNTVDITRRSPSYEVRLSKYASRGFEVYVPQLVREDIDPTIFERNIARIEGLARLLVLEKLSTANDREGYLQSRRELRGRPQKQYSQKHQMMRKYAGDLKANADAGLELSDYGITSLHIPYGPKWDARRIEKLVYQTDLGMNSPFNPKNKDRTLHRHPAFFGTMPECLEDCCEYCPEPKCDEERELQKKEDETYIRGRIQFIVEDPGRQSISGSFNPIDEGEWSEQAYLGPVEKFFNAIAGHDLATVIKLMDEGADVNHRDHVGRTPLQVSIFCKATEIATLLIEKGARMTSRLVDGRTALHLAAQLNLPEVARKLLERSAVNEEVVKAAAAVEEAEAQQKEDAEVDEKMDTDDTNGGMSEEDLYSGDDNEGKEEESAQEAGAMIPEDEEDEPDVFDINTPDWDYGFTPLQYAIVSGSVDTVDLLINAGADPKLITQVRHAYETRVNHSLVLVAAVEDEGVACAIAEKLFSAGCVCSEADDQLLTVFHRMVRSEKPLLVSTFLRCEHNAKSVVNIPYMNDWSSCVFPVVSAIDLGSYSVLSLLVAYGAKLDITIDDFQRARDLKIRKNGRAPDSFTSVARPIEVALSKSDQVAHLLIALGVDINQPTLHTVSGNQDYRITYLDYVRAAQKKAIRDAEPLTLTETEDLTTAGHKDAQAFGWQEEAFKEIARCEVAYTLSNANSNSPVQFSTEHIEYLKDVEATLLANGAKSAAKLYPKSMISEEKRHEYACGNLPHVPRFGGDDSRFMRSPYSFHRHGRSESSSGVPKSLVPLYNELYEACWTGDNAKIQKLCLPRSNSSNLDLPLQISVQWGLSWRGYTPLFFAIRARRWSTAKLILAIATSQHGSEQKKQDRYKPGRISLDGDSDNDDLDEDLDEEFEDSQENAINFTDIAKLRSTVRTTTPASYMLRMGQPVASKDGESVDPNATLMEIAISGGDFEAFIQLLEIYSSLPDGQEFKFMQLLTKHDRPDMLDEYIRRTGLGIEIASEQTEGGEANVPATSSYRAYLWLNVHGKKRKDLAARGDPNAPSDDEKVDDLPLLWQAIEHGLEGTVKYLASEKPLAAYQFYALTHSDELAKYLRSVSDLTEILPKRLGWTINQFNESPVTVAIKYNHFDLLKTIVTLRPKEMQEALYLSHTYFAFNQILAAARWLADTTIFDYLLGKNVSPAMVDVDGWNIYHLLSANTGDKSVKIIKHLLHQLPKDVSAHLLRQQSKNALCIPLHVAVRKQRIEVVQLFVKTGVSQYLQRDSEGFTPLHLAVKDKLPEITKLIASAGPAEALVIEDTVGTTPWETISRYSFTERLDSVSGEHVSVNDGLQPQWSIKPFDVDKVSAELPKLKDTLQQLVAQGKLVNGTKITKEFNAFSARLETKLTAEKVKAEREEKDAKADHEDASELFDIEDTSTTLRKLRAAIEARPLPRRLVALHDVQKSVQQKLKEFEGDSSESGSDSGEARATNCTQLAEDYGEVGY